MLDNTLQDGQVYIGRKLLQVNSPSTSFNATQPIFIVLLCIVIVLAIVFLIIILFLYRRFYLLHKTTFEDPKKEIPIKRVKYPIRPNDTSPSPQLQQTVTNTYVNDVSSLSLETMDVNQLHSYLYIDLHSTSSETFSDSFFQQINSKTPCRSDSYFKQQHYQSNLAYKRSYGPRFLMRERNLSRNLRRLPQLRQATMQQQKNLYGLDDSDNSSTTNHSSTLYSDRILMTYNRNILQNIEEEPYVYEITSMSLSNESDHSNFYDYPSIKANQTVYMNDSILV
ncbi:hypothetical protein I4U23_000934 [Adineta vaga]|nr:hypothetical protein I4U23_000934 [Adineta vaga]